MKQKTWAKRLLCLALALALVAGTFAGLGSASVRAAGAGGNLALSATVVANSTYDDRYVASYAIDGSMDTLWIAKSADAGEKVLTLTWAEPVSINRVVLYSRESTADGVLYDDIKAVTCVAYAGSEELGRVTSDDPKEGEACTVTFAETLTDVTKLELYLGETTGNVGFKEVEVYDGESSEDTPVAPGTNVALGKTATAADGMPTDGLALITDGTKARGWDKSYMYHTAKEAEDTETKPYVTIDLGQSYEIDRIVYFGVWPPDAGYYNTSHNMVIRVSNDPDFADGTTKTVYNTDINNFFGFGAGTDAGVLYGEPKNAEEGIEITFDATTARYVRYYQHGATQQGQSQNCWPNALTVGEMEVYTAQVAPGTNVALGKTVTAAPGMAAADMNPDHLSRVTDGQKVADWEGNFRYRLAVEEEDTSFKPYITVDLGQSYQIDRIVYFGIWPGGFPTYYTTSHNMVIRVSNDPDFDENDPSTKTVYNTDVNNFFGFGEGMDAGGVLYGEPANLEDGITVEFPATEARYVRYYQHGSRVSDKAANCWPNGLSVSELEVYTAGEAAPEMPENGNWALLAKATATSRYDDRYSPMNAIDGNMNTHWAIKGGQDPNPVLTLTWKYPITMDFVAAYSREGKNGDQTYDDIQKVTCIAYDGDGNVLGEAEMSEMTPENTKGVAKFAELLEGVRKLELHLVCEGNAGFLEVEVCEGRTVTFDYQDGGRVETVAVAKGSTVTKPETPVHSELGKRFDKWTVGTAGGEEWDFSAPVTENMTLVANWLDVAVHTVTFDSNGGSAIDPIQVTDGLAFVRPENPTKEGAVFAGWKLNGEPYKFGSPVTASITLVATWVDPAVPDAVTIHAGLLDMTLNSHGEVTNLVSTLDGKDYYADGPDGAYRSLVSLVADYRIETPTSVSYNETSGELTFGFASINATATVKLVDNGDYTSLTLTDVEKPAGVSIQAILWGPIKNSITTGGQTVGTAYDEEFAIGLHMLNTKTIGGWPIEFKDDFYAPDLPKVNGYPDSRVTRDIYVNTAAFSTWGSALQAYSWDYTEDTMRTVVSNSEVKQLYPAMTGEFADELASILGSSVGLYGTRRDNILNVISNIQIKEGLPHTTINGEWQKTSILTGQDFLVFNDAIWGLDVVENDAKMANAAGINYIYGQYGASGPWNGDGSYEFNWLFGGSDENAKLLVEKAAEYGVYVGTHTLSNLISWGTKYMTPEATSALSYAGFSGLTREAKAADTVLYVEDGYPFSNEVVAASNGGRLLRIGGELVTYTDCVKVDDNEYQLTGCTRAVNGTTAADHAVGENVYKLWQYYTCPALGGWDSITPVTDRMGQVYAEIGMHCMSYDSFESTRYSVYSTMLPAMYMKSVYNKVNEAGQADGFLTEASDMYTNVWDVHSRISWGESNTPLNAMLNYLGYYEQNFFPCMLGWMYDYGNHGGYGQAQLLMNLSMKGGWNAGAGWYVNRNTFNTYPYMAEMLRVWNSAIQNGGFVVGGEYTEEVQAAMKNAWVNGRVWTLTEVVENEEWILQEVNKSNLNETIGDPIHLYATNDIDMEQPENGDLATSASKVYSRAHEGDVITVYEQAFTGCHMAADSLHVTGADGTEYELTPVEGKEGAYTFVMPAQAVTITAVFVENGEPADKTELENVIDEARKLDGDDYTEDSWNALQAALAEAEKVLADGEATQEQVDAAKAALEQAIRDLEKKPEEPEEPEEPEKPGKPVRPAEPVQPETPAETLPFHDVHTSDWFYDEVQYVYEEGLMNGVGSGKFDPYGKTTRGMIVTILYRQSGSPAVTSDKAAWWSDARVWAMENGISDGTNMNDFITREQLAAMLYRYAKLTGLDTSARGDLNKFSDAADVSGWAEEAMQWAVGAGIIGGSNGKLNPKGLATRAEVAAMLMRFCKLAK